MELVNERLRIAGESLAGLRRIVIRGRLTDVDRDAALLRLATSVEAVWKAAQAVLARHEGVEVGSPKGCVRACVEARILDVEDAEAAFAAIDARNLAIHAYTEQLAEGVAARLPEHLSVLELWTSVLGRRAGRPDPERT